MSTGLMYQHFSGRIVTKLFADFRTVINSHWQNECVLDYTQWAQVKDFDIFKDCPLCFLAHPELIVMDQFRFQRYNQRPQVKKLSATLLS